MRKNRIIDMEIFTDGSCRKLVSTSSTGFIAYGFAAVEDNKLKFMTVDGSSAPTSTSQRAELLAIIEAVKYAEENRAENQRVIIYSDSAYAINGLTNWIYDWRKNGWVNSKKKEVSNLDLWTVLDPYVDLIDFTFVKVKGHANNTWNNRVDEMVQQYTANAKLNWRGYNNEQ